MRFKNTHTTISPFSMKHQRYFVPILLSTVLFSSCVTKKKYMELQTQVESTEKSIRVQAQSYKTQIDACNTQFATYQSKIIACEQEKEKLNSDLALVRGQLKTYQDQIAELKNQSSDLKMQRDKQYEQIGGLTVLSQSANNNISTTLSQLEKKEKYIHLLQAAKTKTDSLNLALAVNLKSVLQEGILDKDVDIKVDKTVVFINISDKMLFQSGSAAITDGAGNVLSKIAKIIESRPDLEVMVEGYTDNVGIRTSCIEDNWALSTARATAVVRVLQKNYGINPSRMIAAGRGEYNTLANNDTPEGKAINRRTRIILLPKIDQFYDLLNPNNVPK